MQLTTIIFFGLLAFFTWRGYQKGFIKSITRILSWIVAYPAAILLTKPGAALLMQHTSLDGLIVYFVAGSAIFLTVSLLVTLLLTGVAKLIPENNATYTGSKIGGASVGVLFGTFIGLLAVYLLGLVLTPKPAPATTDPFAIDQPATETANPATGAAATLPKVRDLNQANDSFIEASAKKLLGSAAATAVDLALEDKTASQITKAFVQDPQSMLGHVQEMSNNGQMRELMADEKIQSILTTGDTHALMRDPGFKALLDNPSMQALLAQSDVASEEGAETAAKKMVQAWGRVQTLQHDPRVIAIITDPEFQQQLNSANKLPLMMNPKLNQLTQIIFSGETVSATAGEKYEVVDINERRTTNTTPSENADDKPPTQIYRWTDENGQVHFSDKPVINKN